MMDFVALLSNLVKPVMDSLFRWKEGEDKMEISRQQFELMKTQLEANIKLRVEEELRKPDSEFRDFLLSYEGKAEDQSPFMRNFRSSVRPVITYWALIIISAIMFGWMNGTELKNNLAAVPDPLWQIFLAIFGFWFGGRAVQQIAETWKKGDVEKERATSQAQVDVKKIELAQARLDAAQSAASAPAPSPSRPPWADRPW